MLARHEEPLTVGVVPAGELPFASRPFHLLFVGLVMADEEGNSCARDALTREVDVLPQRREPIIGNLN